MMFVSDYAIDQARAKEELAEETVAVKALTPTDAHVMAVVLDGEYVGAVSYRPTGRCVKILNIGVTKKRAGIGRRLIEEICVGTDWVLLWCYAKPEALEFYLSLGMRQEALMPDGRSLMVAER